jgi:hypothetical protein
MDDAAGAGFLTIEADDAFMSAGILENLQLDMPSVRGRKRNLFARILHGYLWMEQPPESNPHPSDQTQSAIGYIFQITHLRSCSKIR